MTINIYLYEKQKYDLTEHSFTHCKVSHKSVDAQSVLYKIPLRLAQTSLKSALVLPEPPPKVADFFWGGYVFFPYFISIHPNLFGESTERCKYSEECL